MRRSLFFLLLRLLLGLGALGLFFLLAQHVNEENVLTDFDRILSGDMAELRERAPVLRVFFFALTLLAALRTMWGLVPLGVILLWTCRQRNAAVVFALCGLSVWLSNNALKQCYNRPRPSAALRDPWVWETNMSFPSGHSSSSMAVFGLLGYLSWRRARTGRQRFWCVAGFGLLILAVGFSRVFLCAHFFSDVLGGYLLGFFWLMVWISVASALGERPAVAPPPSSG